MASGPLESRLTIPQLYDAASETFGAYLATARTSMLFAEMLFNEILEHEQHEKRVQIRLSVSPGIECMVDYQDIASISVPIGAIARIVVTARLLLRFWSSEARISLGNSLLDDLDEDFYHVPEKLRPLFGRHSNNEDRAFWNQLLDLNKMIVLDPAAEPDIHELLHICLIHLVLHEFAHCSQRHFELLRLDLSDDDLRSVGLSRATIGSAIELHADAVAGEMSIRVLLGQLAANADHNPKTGFLRLGYGWTLLFGLYSPKRKYLYAYAETRYAHPVVRRAIVAYHALNEASRVSSEMGQLFIEHEQVGYQRCAFAFTELNLEAFGGKYGAVADGRVLLHLPSVGPATASHFLRQVSDASHLAGALGNLILSLKKEGRIP